MARQASIIARRIGAARGALRAFATVRSPGSLADHREETLQTIEAFYADGATYGGLSQHAHALQTAKQAEDAGFDDQTVVGCLLHDIGWKLAGRDPRGMEGSVNQTPSSESIAAQLGILSFCGAEGADEARQRAQHDVIGATWLRMHGFDEKVAHLVEGHVLAKRYLTFADQEYYDLLSSGSRTTLEFQGGVMTAHEAEIFRLDPLFDECCTLRRWDEGAKVPDLETPSFAHFREKIAACINDLPSPPRGSTTFIRDGNRIVSIARPTSNVITSEDRSKMQESGFVTIPRERWLPGSELDALGEMALQIPELEGAFHTYEQTSVGVLPSRTEGFASHHDGLMQFLNNAESSRLRNLVSELVGEEVTLYKEKLNYKHPGGGGYTAHQDGYLGLGVPTDPYKFMAYVCMIALDDFTLENGAPEVSVEKWQQKDGMAMRKLFDRGANSKEVHKALTEDFVEMHKNELEKWPFEPVLLKRGDVLIYDNYMPHRSAENQSETSRRAFFAVYSPLRWGNLREKYYENEARNRRAKGSQMVQGRANSFFTGTAAEKQSA